MTNYERIKKQVRKMTVEDIANALIELHLDHLETKSKRLQLLIQPSLLDKLKGKAKAEGRSVNDLVHSILEEALKGE